MRTRTRGIQLADCGGRIVNKEYKGQRIFQRLGNVSQNDAEAWLSGRQAEIDAERANSLRRGGHRLWADAARKYLIECKNRKVRPLDLISYHVSLLLPYIPWKSTCATRLASGCATPASGRRDRVLLLGHAIEGKPQHYATATVARLVNAANSAAMTRDRTTLLRVAND